MDELYMTWMLVDCTLLHAAVMSARRSSDESLSSTSDEDGLMNAETSGGSGIARHEALRCRSSDMTRSKVYALITVCLMSIGSHFGMYLLGPLKTRLHREMGTSNSQFSLLIASFNLNSTWTPLVAGLFVTRFGTAWSSISTTFCVLAGQLILFLGVSFSHLNIMAFGMFIFGLGTTPLSVVQETLVSQLSPSRHLGLSLALGLLSGKSSSFISSLVSLPLANRYGDLIPFALASSLCCLSFFGNGLRLWRGWGVDHHDEKHHAAPRHGVSWGGVYDFGDVFWVYILLNILSGAIWQPFLHLSANLLQVRYASSETVASQEASVLLAGAVVLYPIVGYLTDRFNPSTPQTTFTLLHISSVLTLLAYSFLLLPPGWTGSPWLAMVLFTMGYGMATLLLVILVPRLLPARYIPLGLGLHKSMEMASSSLSQTLAGLWLDWTSTSSAQASQDLRAGTGLLWIFWTINILQLGCVVVLYRFERARRLEWDGIGEKANEYEQLPMSAVSDDCHGSEFRDLQRDDLPERSDDDRDHLTLERPEAASALSVSEEERRRGKYCFYTSLGFIAFVWTVFLVSAWSRL